MDMMMIDRVVDQMDKRVKGGGEKGKMPKGKTKTKDGALKGAATKTKRRKSRYENQET